MCVLVVEKILCVCMCVSADAPFAGVIVRECQRPVCGGQRACAARAVAAAWAALLLTRWSTSESAWGGGRPLLHSWKNNRLCAEILM